MEKSAPDEGEGREGANGLPTGVIEPHACEGKPPEPAPRPEEAADAARAGDPPRAQPEGGLLPHLQAIDIKLEALHQDFEAKLKYDEAKDRQLDTLHRELQAHRDDLYFKILRPVLMDLIAMYDDLHSIVRHEDGRDSADLSDGEVRMRRNLASFAETIEEILERYGVSAFADEAEVVSPQRQRSIKQIETSDAGQDRRIAERLRKGFCHGDKVLRPELVATYRAAPKRAVSLSNGGSE
jgi:molecular chaperone GrpE